jgi:hypothetical protein
MQCGRPQAARHATINQRQALAAHGGHAPGRRSHKCVLAFPGTQGASRPPLADAVSLRKFKGSKGPFRRRRGRCFAGANSSSGRLCGITTAGFGIPPHPGGEARRGATPGAPRICQLRLSGRRHAKGSGCKRTAARAWVRGDAPQGTRMCAHAFPPHASNHAFSPCWAGASLPARTRWFRMTAAGWAPGRSRGRPGPPGCGAPWRGTRDAPPGVGREVGGGGRARRRRECFAAVREQHSSAAHGAEPLPLATIAACVPGAFRSRPRILGCSLPHPSPPCHPQSRAPPYRPHALACDT